MLGIGSEHLLRQQNLAFDMDCWGPGLVEGLRFVPVRPWEARAAVAHYRAWMGIAGGTFDASHAATLEELERRISEALPGGPVFARLCGRSPKDSALRIDPATEFPAEPQAQYEAMTEARRIAHRCTSARAVMWTLLTSERVYADLLDVCEYGEPEQVVLRPWDERMRMRNEWRVFVRGGRVVAISQYDHYGYYGPRSADECAAIEAAIVRAVEPLVRVVGVPSLVCDFHVTATECILVELSPFRRCTGPALFSWDELDTLPDGQRAVLRWRQQPHPQLAEMMEVWMHTNLRTALPPVPYFEHCTQRAGFLQRLWAAAWPPAPATPPTQRSEALFVYGTLKQGMHWHSKYMDGAQLVGPASTRAVRLVLGECGVPYALPAANASDVARGELFLVAPESLALLDEYEGVAKGHYERRCIQCTVDGAADATTASVYCASAQLIPQLAALAPIPEYTLELHRAQYKAVAHIEVKQRIYLREEALARH